MRAVALLLLLAAPLAAQYPAPPTAPAAAADPDRMVAGAGLPAGWNGRTDRGQPLVGAKVEAKGAGFNVTTGPAAIFWRAADRANGAFHTVASFTQVKAPASPEAFGMFVAGSALDSVNQAYIYLLVRGDGAYMIKRRVGAVVTAIVDWTPSAAVNRADSAGKATNKLEIQNTDGSLTFSINGTQVHAMEIPVADTRGIVGLRVNHNLDVVVEGFAVHNIRR